MEIISKPKIVREKVKDFDVAFVAAKGEQFTLRKGDTLKVTARTLILSIKSTGHRVTFERSNVTWWSVMDRIIEKVVKPTVPAPASVLVEAPSPAQNVFPSAQ